MWTQWSGSCVRVWSGLFYIVNVARSDGHENYMHKQVTSSRNRHRSYNHVYCGTEFSPRSYKEVRDELRMLLTADPNAIFKGFDTTGVATCGFELRKFFFPRRRINVRAEIKHSE